MGIKVTERDKKVIRLIWESKVMSYAQVKAMLFNGLDKGTVSRRMQKLVRAGLIKKIGFGKNGTIVAGYGVSKDGFGVIAANDKTVKLGQLKSDSVDHDLALVDIRNRFSKLKQIEVYYSENVLQNRIDFTDDSEFGDFVEIHSDAVSQVKIDDESFLIPIEYEASLKSKTRCQGVLLRYYSRPEIEAILYICKGQQVLNRMKSVDREVSKEFGSKVYFAKLKDVLCDSNSVTFENTEGTRFTLS